MILQRWSYFPALLMKSICFGHKDVGRHCMSRGLKCALAHSSSTWGVPLNDFCPCHLDPLMNTWCRVDLNPGGESGESHPDLSLEEADQPCLNQWTHAVFLHHWDFVVCYAAIADWYRGENNGWGCWKQNIRFYHLFKFAWTGPASAPKTTGPYKAFPKAWFVFLPPSSWISG